MTAETDRQFVRFPMIIRMLLFLPLWLALSPAVAVAVIAALPGPIDEAGTTVVPVILGVTALVMMVLLWLLIRRRRWRFLVALAVVELALAGAWIGLHEAGRDAYAHAVDKWIVVGGTTDYGRLWPAPVPDEQNAAVAYEEAFQLIPEAAVQDAEVSAALSDPWAASAEQLDTIVASHAQTLVLLHQSGSRPACVWSLPADERSRHLRYAFCGRAAALLVVDAVVKARGDDLAPSILSLMIALRLGRQMVAPGDLDSHMARARIETDILEAYERLLRDRDERFEQIQIPEAMLAGRKHRPLVHQTLLGTPAFTFYARGIRAERTDLLTPIGMLWTFVSDREQFGDGLAPWVFIPGNVYRDMAAYLTWSQQVLDALGRPRYRQDLNATPRVDTLPAYAGFARVIANPEALRVYNESIARHEARIQLAVLAGRLRAYKGANGQYPETLDALDQVPVDPWNGQPIEYQTDGAGFRLTSAAPQGEDGHVDWHWAK